MANVIEIKNEWTPTLEALLDKLSRPERKKFFGDLGMKTVAVIKNKMSRSKGFGNNRRYKKLKIKWRYHGQKELAASPRNMARRARGARVSGEGRIRVTDKTKVTSSTKPLIDLGHLLRSWAVRSRRAGAVEIGPRTPAEMEKAHYNDDRGQWNWKKKSADMVMRELTNYIDEGVFINFRAGGIKKRRNFGARSHYGRRFR